MNALNIGSLLYISFRLAPFILVSYFTLSSLFNQDFKGLIYIAGLLITSFLAILIGNQFPNMFESVGYSADNTYENMTKVCNLMTISKSGPLSNLPLSMVVFSYTFGYLLVPIVKYKLETQNIPTLVIFPIIILADMIWQILNSCSTTAGVLVGMIVSGLAGVGWSFFIDSTKVTSLQYFNGISNKESCSVPSKQYFKCRVKSINGFQTLSNDQNKSEDSDQSIHITPFSKSIIPIDGTQITPIKNNNPRPNSFAGSALSGASGAMGSVSEFKSQQEEASNSDE